MWMETINLEPDILDGSRVGKFRSNVLVRGGVHWTESGQFWIARMEQEQAKEKTGGRAGELQDWNM